MEILIGYKDVDKRIGNGLQNGFLYLIAARPAMGKTSFILNIMDHICTMQKKTALMFSCEFSRRQVMDRLISIEGNIVCDTIREGRLSGKEWEGLIKVADTFKDSVKLASFKNHNEEAIDEVCKLYGGSSRSQGRTRGTILRFLSIQKDDIVIVPCYKGFCVGKATGELCYVKEYSDFDRVNAIKVDFKKDSNGEPIFYERSGKNTALTTKMGTQHIVLEIRETKLQKEIDLLLENDKDISINNRVLNIEQA